MRKFNIPSTPPTANKCNRGFMNDAEYAVCIYCHTFKVEDDGGDTYVSGVMEALSTLPKCEQLVLEYRVRNGMTYKKIGELLGGISASQVRRIVLKAIKMLFYFHIAQYSGQLFFNFVL